jgi:hypothetical protein
MMEGTIASDKDFIYAIHEFTLHKITNDLDEIKLSVTPTEIKTSFLVALPDELMILDLEKSSIVYYSKDTLT